MTRMVRLLALVLIGSAAVAARADDPPVPSDPTTGEKFDLARPKFVGEWNGKVVKVSGGDAGGTLTLRVDQVVARPAAGRRMPVRPVASDLELPLAKDVAVRVLKLPPVEDDKGKPRQRTAEELRKLKGPSNLPGYIGEFSQVRADDVVRVHLVQPKRPKDAKSSDPAPKPLVAMIVIVNEAPAKK